MHVSGHLTIPEPCYLVRSFCMFQISTNFVALWPYTVDIEASALVCLGFCHREVMSLKPGGVLGRIIQHRNIGNWVWKIDDT